MEQQQSQNWFSRAQEVIPGGVNSPVRAFNAVEGTPPFIVSAEGPYMTDEDGNRYIDRLDHEIVKLLVMLVKLFQLFTKLQQRDIIWCTNQGRSSFC